MTDYYFNETEKKELDDYTLEDFTKNGKVKEPLITYDEFCNTWRPSALAEIREMRLKQGDTRQEIEESMQRLYRTHLVHLRIHLLQKYGYERNK